MVVVPMGLMVVVIVVVVVVVVSVVIMLVLVLLVPRLSTIKIVTLNSRLISTK